RSHAPSRAFAAAQRRAAAVAARVGRGDGMVAVLARLDDDRARLLPFLLHTSSLFVLSERERDAARDELTRARPRLVGTAGGARILDAHLRGWQALVVDLDD